MDIGHRMKELRIQYGLTQQELADRAELTKGFISQLERNQNSPSVGTLLDIIQCLGMTPAEFFTDSEPEQIVYKANDYFEKIDEEKNSKVEWIIPNAQKNEMEPILIELEANAESKLIEPHEGEEFGYVLRGRVLLVRDSNKKGNLLRKGDSFYIRGDESHYLKNDTDKKAVVLWVSTPPEF